MASKEKPATARVTWAQAFRDIVVASINKGQLPLVIFGAVVFLVIYRLPEAEVSWLVTRIMDRLEDGYLLGWALFVLTIGGWFMHARRQHRIMSHEIERLSRERSNLQAVLGGKVQSSGSR